MGKKNIKGCCLCETDKHSEPYKKVNEFSLFKCKKCSLVYLDINVSVERFIDTAKEDLNRKDKKIEYWSFPEIYDRYGFIFKKFFRERLSRCFRYHPNIKSIFDIGVGYGFWMNYCKQRGIGVKGIDIAEEAVKYAQEVFQLDVEVSALADFHFDKCYDVYTLCDVLEHIANPNYELQIIRKAMNRDSLFYVQVPNVLGIRIPYKHNLGLPYHFWQFNFKTLKKLLEKNGFIIVKRYYGVQGVIGTYLKEDVNILKRLEWFIAKKFCLGNRLVVLCRRTY